MDKNILVNGLMINVMDMAYFTTMIKATMRENGKMDKSMGRELQYKNINLKKTKMFIIIQVYENGERYEGLWQGDLKHGPGIFYWQDGSYF